MSPLSKKGTYHANPATAAMHDKPAPAEAPIADPGTQPEAQAMEIHSPSHPETGDGQNFHLRVHHADGNMEESKHPSFEEASQAGSMAMGCGGGDTAEDTNDAGEPDSDSDDEY